MNTLMPTEQEVLLNLRNVMDPEVGMNIVDLGLVYGVTISGKTLQVDLTMTTPTCPMSEMIQDDARQTLRALVPKGARIVLNLVWEPQWTPDLMTDYARRHFGWGKQSGEGG